MEFNIITVPHDSQRYETAGDYTLNRTTRSIDIKVSDMDNMDYEFLVGLHEMIESYLCYRRGIRFNAIDAFDINFEKNRKKGNTDEPGDDKKAPYYKEHQFATKIEKEVAKELKVDWNKYNKAIYNL